MIPDEAVEAAARALAAELGYQDDDWEPEVRVILEAAAPHLMAAAGYGPVREAKEAAWDECEAAKYEIRLEPGGKFWQPYKDNPYRTT